MGLFSGKTKKKMGLLRPEDLEKSFDRRMSIIYPTQSPINSLAGPPEETEEPEPMIPKFSGRFMKRLLESREDLEKVYSNGYLQTHYPEADKNLKEFLHQQTMNSWAKALDKEDDDHKEPDGDEAPNFTVVININK